MEKLKLYNWYGEEFDTILPEQQNTLKSYKLHVKNVVARRIRRINAQKKIDKNLFLRAKTKLQDNLGRELSSLRAAYVNKLKVIKENKNLLSFTKTPQSFIKKELNRLKKQKKELYLYVKDFRKSLKLTTDPIERKKELLFELKTKTKSDEQEIFAKYAIYNITIKYINKYDDKDFDIKKISSSLSDYELNFINNIKNVNDYFKLFFEKLEERRKEVKDQQLHQAEKYAHNIDLEKRIYKANCKNIKLETKQKILASEYEYNQKAQILKNEVKLYKKEAFSKIKEHKELINKSNNTNISKIKKIKNNAKYQIKKITLEYKKSLKNIPDLIAKKSYEEYCDFLLKNNIIKNKVNENQKITNNSTLRDFIRNEEIVYNSELKSLPLCRILKKTFFGSTNLNTLKKEYIWLLQSELHLKKAEIYDKFSYEGKYEKEIGYSLKEKAIGTEQVRLEFLEEKASTLFYSKIDKLDLSLLKNNELINEKDRLTKLYLREKNSVKENKKTIKKEYDDTILQLKNKFKNKEISKQAFKHSKLEAKIAFKEKMYELKIQTESLKNKEILKTWFIRRHAEMKILAKIYESKVNEATKTIPIEPIPHIKWICTILSLFIPGLSELIFFKQKIKGIILLSVTLFFYAILIPFCFGFYTQGQNGMEGILSFIDLGARHHNTSMGVFRDARRYLFGGVLSVIVLTITIIFFIACAINSYRTAQLLEEGSRPSKWSYTKRWLNTSGFPWMISIIGWIFMLFIVLAPIITSVLISFTDYGYLHQAPSQPVHWVGLKQWGLWWLYRENGMITALQRIIGWTVIWTIASTLCPIALGILLAILANNQYLKGKKFFRLIFIIPWAIPAFVMLYFLRTAFVSGDSGYINLILLKLGIIKTPIEWLTRIDTARATLIVVQTWIAYAFIFMLVTGNLQAIPRDIYEAASIDGAKGRHKFLKLTLPSLLLAIAPMLIGQFIGAFNNFATISIFTGGDPKFSDTTAYQEGATDILISFIYKLTTGVVKIESDQAFAAALTTLAALFSIAIAARGFIKSMTRRD
ncbi:ABC transporter permease subunit [Mycoplasma elephantis]|uniref:ABC transporter permease subunit n=1 Tax=Mycoplasma elephantis TaxID=114882 RepID=UPI0004823D72|nr:ABC transporter permease subunit [Mycoplasma elephantis]